MGIETGDMSFMIWRSEMGYVFMDSQWGEPYMLDV